MLQASLLTMAKHHYVSSGLLDLEALTRAMDEANKKNMPLISYLVKNDRLSSQSILIAFSRYFNMPSFDLTHYDLTWLDSDIIQFDLIRRYRIIPLRLTQEVLEIGIADPVDQPIIDTLSFQTGLPIKLILVDENQLNEWIGTYCGDSVNTDLKRVNLLKQITLHDASSLIQETNSQGNEPLSEFVNNMIRNAGDSGASDIHIEPYEVMCRIRCRHQGILIRMSEIPMQLAARIIMRLKVIAKLDTAEKRLPQDGRFQLDHFDVRVNTCPTLFGEKIVLRLFNSRQSILSMDELGFSPIQQKIFINTITQSQGMLLVTGPTGSGKSVTLYSALNYLNTTEKNISTVEDPVEMYLSNINQVNVNSKIGLTFSTILRALLRQDPDIIMIGEVRDKEAADIAMQAAQTGHLIFSTLHTNNAIESITRLKALGVPSCHIVSAITLIVAQRLMRKLCDHCKIPMDSPPAFCKEMASPITLFQANGCQFCANGYRGRIAIYEFLPMTEEVIQFIVSNETTRAAPNPLINMGFVSLKQMALEKIRLGITTLSEMHRVLSR